MTKEDILKRYFGYTGFRRGQGELIDNILQGRDVLGVMPTGAGKSICYQVPALIFKGITIVISPLISLMRDQVQSLILSGVPAAFINSALSIKQTDKVIENARAGKYKIIYVAPERLVMDEFVGFAGACDIAMVTVDEAHCVSQWGQDFRPSYLKINEFIDMLPKRPVISAFTATATPEIKDDIVKILRFDKPYIVSSGFDRENLYFEVKKPADKYKAVLQYLQNNPGKSGIIYCATRKTTEQVCADLIKDNYNATRYHAGLTEQERSLNQDDFLYDRKTVMVATNAFGMGIDKSNVNFVIHYNMPKNIESYYQEAGRAGRDGTDADCILLYGGQDVVTNQFLIDHTNEQNELQSEMLELFKEKERERLKQMTYYCHTTECLRAYILNYFGDKTGNWCGNCGNCRQNYETADILEESKKILSCIYRMRERFGIQTLIDTLRGSKNQKILNSILDRLPTYGIMKELSQNRIRQIINFLVLKGYIVLTNGEYPTAALGPGYRQLLDSKEPFLMKIAAEPKKALKEKPAAKQKLVEFTGRLDKSLYDKMKELRFRLAKENNVPAFVIFSDATLIDMCKKCPANQREMLEVSGVGEVKSQRYGTLFLNLIAEHGITERGETQKASENEKALSLPELCDYIKDSFVPSEEAVSVTVLADMLSALLLQKSNIKLSGAQLSKFYEEKGFLQTETSDGKNNRVANPAGNALGITVKDKTDAKGNTYRQNFYNASAQKWAAENLLELLRVKIF